jgi:carboxymethylenebutenolidase
MQGKTFQEMGQISGRITRAQYLGDLRAAVEHARQQPWARADRLGVTGFCGGGALTFHVAAEFPGVTAAVPWYGHLRRVYPDAPGVDALSLADRITVPVLGLYGEADGGIPVDEVRRMEAELRKRNPEAEFVL